MSFRKHLRSARSLRVPAAIALVLPLGVPAEAIYVVVGANPRVQVEFSRVDLDGRQAGGELWGDGVGIGANFPAAANNVLVGPGRNHFDVDYATGEVFFDENKLLFNNWTYDSRTKSAANLVPARPDAKARTHLMLVASPWGGGIRQQAGFSAIDDNFNDATATVNVTALDTVWATEPWANGWLQTGSACWWRGFVPEGAELSFGLRCPATGFDGANLNMPDIVFSVDGVDGSVQTPGGPVALVGGVGDDFVKVGAAVAVIAAAGDGQNSVSAEINTPTRRAKLTLTPARRDGQNGWSYTVWAVGLGNLMPPAANPAVQRANVQAVYTIIADPGASIESAEDVLPPDVELPDWGGPDPALASQCPDAKGDADCSGSVDFFDIDPFLQALFDINAYAASYCNGSVCGVDTNCDGMLDFFDIDSFLMTLFAGEGPCD